MGVFMEQLYELFHMNVKTVPMPNDWTNDTIVPLCKAKGRKSDCKTIEGLFCYLYLAKRLAEFN